MHYEWCSLTAIGSCVEDRGCVDVVSVKWTSVAKIAGKIWCLSIGRNKGCQVQ